MTPAQRVKRNRDKAREAVLMSLEKMTSSNTAALLGGLARQIKLIETEPQFADSAREGAAMLMGELCKRYEINLPNSNPAKFTQPPTG
ncbi:MAG TPA: hypothetical protein PLB25_04490 [Rhodoferax sp.]|nr:hypothetical protein [Rhodoferax sp.]